jgi:hypothetical protein
MTNRICGWPFQNAPKGSNCVKYGSTYWFFETNSRILEMGRRRRKSRSGRAVVPKPSQTRSVGIWRRFFAGNGNARQQMRALGTASRQLANLGRAPTPGRRCGSEILAIRRMSNRSLGTAWGTNRNPHPLRSAGHKFFRDASAAVGGGLVKDIPAVIRKRKASSVLRCALPLAARRIPPDH